MGLVNELEKGLSKVEEAALNLSDVEKVSDLYFVRKPGSFNDVRGSQENRVSMDDLKKVKGFNKVSTHPEKKVFGKEGSSATDDFADSFIASMKGHVPMFIMTTKKHGLILVDPQGYNYARYIAGIDK